jgi:Uma2 family endonuclease
VPLVWVLRTRRKTISVHRSGREVIVLGIGDVLDGEDVLPGFRLPLAELFRVRS